jgi:ribosomal protein L29
MNIKELRQKTEQELTDMLKKAEKDLNTAMTDLLQKKEKNVKKPGFLRKDIARIETILNEKKILNKGETK